MRRCPARTCGSSSGSPSDERCETDHHRARAARARRAPRRRRSAAPPPAPAPPTSPPAATQAEMPRGNADNLRAAAQRKRHAATERAETALERADRQRRADHVPRPGEDGRRVDRLPIPLTAARPDRAAPRRAAAHTTRPIRARDRARPATIAEQRRARAHRAARRSSSATTAPRSHGSKRHSPPPKERTSNYGAGSAAQPPPDRPNCPEREPNAGELIEPAPPARSAAR